VFFSGKQKTTDDYFLAGYRMPLFVVSLSMFASLASAITYMVIRLKALPFYIMHALPSGLSGLLITGIFAASMSSMDSGINSMAAMIMSDFIKPLRHKARTDREDVRLARILTFGLGAVAIGVACYASRLEHILKASSAFLGLFGGPILAIFLLGIFTRRANFWGWLVGTAIAIAVTLMLQYIELQPGQKLHFIYYFPICMGISIIVGYPMSLLFGGPKAEAELTMWGTLAMKFRKDLQ